MNETHIIKSLFVTIAVLVGIIVALAAGILAKAGGAALSVAVTRGGVAFGGAVSLVMVVFSSTGLL